MNYINGLVELGLKGVNLPYWIMEMICLGRVNHSGGLLWSLLYEAKSLKAGETFFQTENVRSAFNLKRREFSNTINMLVAENLIVVVNDHIEVLCPPKEITDGLERAHVTKLSDPQE